MTLHLLIPLWQVLLQAVLLWLLLILMLAPFMTLAVAIYYSTQREASSGRLVMR